MYQINEEKLEQLIVSGKILIEFLQNLNLSNHAVVNFKNAWLNVATELRQQQTTQSSGTNPVESAKHQDTDAAAELKRGIKDGQKIWNDIKPKV